MVLGHFGKRHPQRPLFQMTRHRYKGLYRPFKEWASPSEPCLVVPLSGGCFSKRHNTAATQRPLTPSQRGEQCFIASGCSEKWNNQTRSEGPPTPSWRGGVALWSNARSLLEVASPRKEISSWSGQLQLQRVNHASKKASPAQCPGHLHPLPPTQVHN